MPSRLVARLRAQMPDESPIDLDAYATAIAQEVTRMKAVSRRKTPGKSAIKRANGK